MAKIDVQPILIRDLLARFGGTTGDTYEEAVTAVTITPTSGTVSFQGGTPDASFQFPTATTWAVQIDFAQDWTNPKSLARYLWDHRNDDSIEFTFAPKNGGPSWDVEVIPVPGAIGGAVNAVATASVTLPVQGEPVPTFPAA